MNSKKKKSPKTRNYLHFLTQVQGGGSNVYKNKKKYDRKRDKRVKEEY